MVWSCLPFIRPGQNHLARHSERRKKTRRTKEEGGGDNIREWTGLEFGKFQRAVENRGKGRKLVAKSSVVPQRPSRLRILMIMMMMILLWSSAVRVHDSQAYRKMDVTGL